MPIRNSELQGGKILHTVLEGEVTGAQLIPYYRGLIKSGVLERHYLELIDGMKVERFLVKDADQEKLAAFFKKHFTGIATQMHNLAAGKLDLKAVLRYLPASLVNTQCDPEIARILGLPRNCQVSRPPEDAEKLKNLLEWHLRKVANTRLAMVAEDDAAFAVFKLWEARREKLGYPIKAFRTIAEGAAWLLKEVK